MNLQSSDTVEMAFFYRLWRYNKLVIQISGLQPHTHVKDLMGFKKKRKLGNVRKEPGAVALLLSLDFRFVNTFLKNTEYLNTHHKVYTTLAADLPLIDIGIS
jgi:hypothetical protein